MKVRYLTLASLLAAAPAFAQAQDAASPPADTHDHQMMMDHGTMDHEAMDHSAMKPAPAPEPPAPQHHAHGDMMPTSAITRFTRPQDTPCPDASTSPPASCSHPPAFSESSGTARLPGLSDGMSGLHIMSDKWMFMTHGFLALNYTDHSGPRGDDLVYSQSMLMLRAERDLNGARLSLRSMLSLEPTMTARGYPNLFGTGETAGGQPLVDRQHPHDLFMELAARLDVDIADNVSVFLYGGPVGEPAIGPAVFMMRASARFNPEPPISHHWFDATHITYGVVTAGLASPHWQIEGSAFRGREPDEDRWDIETPKLDSWSARLSWNPSPRWTAQLSHAFLKTPESLHGDQNERRTVASLHYGDGRLAAMAGFSAKNRDPGPTLTAWLAEATYDLTPRHSLFGRVESVDNDELVPDHASPLHDVAFRVSKAQLGYAWNTPLGGSPLNLALGGSVNLYGKPAALDALYGRNPWGYTLFARLSLGR